MWFEGQVSCCSFVFSWCVLEAFTLTSHTVCQYQRKATSIPPSLHPTGVKSHGNKCPSAPWWSQGSGPWQITDQLVEQINDNYPADMSTVITLQDQEQGRREMKKEGMKGCGPHLALSWSIPCEIWLWPAPRPGLIAAQQAITAFLHRAVQSHGLCVLMCVAFQSCQKEISLVWQLTHQYQPGKMPLHPIIPHRKVFKVIILKM